MEELIVPDRVGIYVDGPNLYGCTRDLCGDGRLDIPALARYLANGRTITEFVYWNAQLKQGVDSVRYAGQQRFLADIEKRIPNASIGRANLIKRGREWIEKGVDVGVALGLIAGAYEDKWDVGIAVTGDGDLAGVGPLLRTRGKLYEVVYCEGSLSGFLEAAADTCRKLDAKTLARYRYTR